jgi:hypothetical protein
LPNFPTIIEPSKKPGRFHPNPALCPTRRIRLRVSRSFMSSRHPQQGPLQVTAALLTMTKFEQQTSSESSIGNAPDRSRSSHVHDEINSARMAQSGARSERPSVMSGGSLQFDNIYGDCAGQTHRAPAALSERERNWRPDANSTSEKAQEWKRQHEQQRQKSFDTDSNGAYKVEKGDSMSGIAQRSLKAQGNEHASQKDIQRETERLIKINPELGGKGDLVKPGMTLRTIEDNACRPCNPDGTKSENNIIGGSRTEPNITKGHSAESNMLDGSRTESNITKGRSAESNFLDGSRTESNITNGPSTERNSTNGPRTESGITNRPRVEQPNMLGGITDYFEGNESPSIKGFKIDPKILAPSGTIEKTPWVIPKDGRQSGVIDILI